MQLRPHLIDLLVEIWDPSTVSIEITWNSCKCYSKLKYQDNHLSMFLFVLFLFLLFLLFLYRFVILEVFRQDGDFCFSSLYAWIKKNAKMMIGIILHFVIMFSTDTYVSKGLFSACSFSFLKDALDRNLISGKKKLFQQDYYYHMSLYTFI